MTIQHGWQTCRACHHRGQDIRVEGDWHLRANPGYWGASAPEVLVLGFSKGATQIAAAKAGDFDGVAFAKMRPRLRQVLDALGVDLKGQTIDEALSANGQQIGAASLIRCGLSVMENGKLVTSGTIMPKAARAPFPRHVMRTCITHHLDPLPTSVSRVLLLGTTNAYIQGVKTLMREQFPDYRDINEVAFQAQGRTWVFAAHPSPANGEFKKWLSGTASDTSGLKRILAQRALSTRAEPSPHEPRPAIPTPPLLLASQAIEHEPHSAPHCPSLISIDAPSVQLPRPLRRHQPDPRLIFGNGRGRRLLLTLANPRGTTCMRTLSDSLSVADPGSEHLTFAPRRSQLCRSSSS